MTRFVNLPGKYAECGCGRVFRRGSPTDVRCGHCQPAPSAAPSSPAPVQGPAEVRFTVVGNPVQWKRAAGTQRRVNDADHTRWAARVHDVAQAAVGPGVAYPTGPVILGMVFALTPPPTSGSGVWATHGHSPDLSNLVKLVEDAIQGVCYADDRQVVAYGDPSPAKVYSAEPMTVVTVRRAGLPSLDW